VVERYSTKQESKSEDKTMNTIKIENGFVNGVYDIESSVTASDKQKAIGNNGSAKFTLRVNFVNIPLDRIMYRAASAARISHQNSGLREMSETAINNLNGSIQEYTENAENRKIETGPIKQLDNVYKEYTSGKITWEQAKERIAILEPQIKAMGLQA
jgi:hypothetical protein